MANPWLLWFVTGVVGHFALGQWLSEQSFRSLSTRVKIEAGLFALVFRAIIAISAIGSYFYGVELLLDVLF